MIIPSWLYRILTGLLIVSWIVAAPYVFLEVLADARLSTKGLVAAWFLFALGHTIGEFRRGQP